MILNMSLGAGIRPTRNLRSNWRKRESSGIMGLRTNSKRFAKEVLSRNQRVSPKLFPPSPLSFLSKRFQNLGLTDVDF